MTEWGTLLVVLLVLAGTLPLAVRQWREDRAGAVRTVAVLAAYIAYVIAGVAILVSVLPLGDDRLTFPVTALVLLWIAYGVLWLIRLVPKYRQVPAWMNAGFGKADVALIAAMLALLGVIASL